MLDFDTYKIEAIKIDTHLTYNVESERAELAQWKSGVPAEQIQMSPSNQKWLEGIVQKTAAGARHIRIKLIPDTGPNEYRRFGYDVDCVPQTKFGAQILFILQSDFLDLVHKIFPDGWQPNDFWLFDLKEGFEQFYNDDFSYRGEEPMSADTVKKYLTLRNAVMASDKIFGMEEFRKRYLK